VLVVVSEYRKASLLDHVWVSTVWLDSVGLSQYSASFDAQLVDARVLNVLSRKDLDKHLNIHNKFHQSSILHAVQLLRMTRFDIHVSPPITAYHAVCFTALTASQFTPPDMTQLDRQLRVL